MFALILSVTIVLIDKILQMLFVLTSFINIVLMCFFLTELMIRGKICLFKIHLFLLI